MPNSEPSSTRRWIVHLSFCALLVYTWRAGRPNAQLAPPDADQHNGLRLQESAQALGLEFRHRPTQVDPAVANIAEQITAVGAAVSVCDPNGDGLPDLYVTSSADHAPNALFVNRGGKFEDMAAAAGVADLNQPGDLACMGSVWADYDNDGDQDAFVYGWGQSRLLRNEGELRFVDVTAPAGCMRRMNTNAATWLDFDRDGRLDLYVAGYFAEEHNLRDLETTRIMQDSFEFSNNGGRNRLLRNKGDGTFEDVSAPMGITGTRWTYAAVSADFDRDGWPDLYIANDYGPEELYFNKEGTRFELAKDIGLEGESKSGMCVALGDVWSQGKLSVFVTNISERGFLFQGNNLRVSLLDSDGWMMQLAEGAVADCGWAWGAQFGDLDDDGFQDIVVANGFISASRERDYWYQMSKVSLATGDLVADATLWPEIGDRSLSGYQRTRVLRNLGKRSGRFVEVGASVGVDDTFDGRGVAMADLDSDGKLDVVIASQNGPLLAYINKSTDNGHWIAFELRGTRSNREAIGAEIEVEFAGQRQLQVRTSATGFASQNEGRLRFGLGHEPGEVRAHVLWPSGARTEIDAPELDRIHVVTETEATR